MRTVGLTTLDNQRLRLEREILEAKKKIAILTDSDYLDMNSINQLKDSIERNMQLISMISQHRPAKVSSFSAKVV
jgi:hypothetical protein